MHITYALKPSTANNSGRDPERPSLGFGVHLIGLDLADIDCALADDLLLYRFGMRSSFGLPIGDGAFIEAKGKDHRRNRTATGEQRQHDPDQPERMFQAKERRAGGLREGLATGMADVAAFFERMDATASACATDGVRAYYQLWTHRWKGGIEHAPNLLMRSVLSNGLHDVLQCYPR